MLQDADEIYQAFLYIEWLCPTEHVSDNALTTPVILLAEVLQVCSQIALVGEIPYDSIVTKMEVLSIAVSVIGSPGMYF